MIKENNIERVMAHFKERSLLYDNNSDWVKDSYLLDSIANYIPDVCKTILELGAGTGVVSKYYLNHRNSAIKVYAVDISQDMLNMIDDKRVECICANIEVLPFADNSFDAIVSRQCLHYVDHIDEAVMEGYRVLKDDGYFVLAQIVPYDNSTAEEWANIIKIRQPLRKCFYSGKEWNTLFEKHRFEIIGNKSYCLRGSVNKWANKYSIQEDAITVFADSLLNSSDIFKTVYNVVDDGTDVTYNSFWHIALYKK